MKGRLIVAGMGMVVAAGLAAGASAGGSPHVDLAEGRIGKSAWVAWAEPRRGTKRGKGVCLGLALSKPADAGLVSVGESLECGPEVGLAPRLESIAAGDGRNQRSVWVLLFNQSVSRAFIHIGRRDGRTFRIRRITHTEASRLGIEGLGYWAQGFAGSACLHRLTTFGAQGEVLTDVRDRTCA